MCAFNPLMKEIFLFINIILFSYVSFSYKRCLMVSQWNMRDCKSPQISGTVLSILADLNNAAVWMVSPRTLICKSSCPYTNPITTVLSAPIPIADTVSLMFHRGFFFFFLVLQLDL